MTSNHGWTCPKCGRVYAPYVPECRECNERAGITLAKPPPFPTGPTFPTGSMPPSSQGVQDDHA